jgi:hypothetical protein
MAGFVPAINGGLYGSSRNENMYCHICKAEAVTRCYTCGELVCGQHGKQDTCATCNTGFAEGDPRADRICTKPLPQKQHHGWWRPQQAEEYVPPACYECQGLTRAVCRNCESPYCHEHAGPNGLCKACGRSCWLGQIILAIMGGMMLLVCLWNWLAQS